MKLGTPGFVGERLRAARFVRAMTAQALADDIRVTPAAVSQYENGHQTPSPEVMYRICESLSFPKAYFCNSRDKLDGAVFFRSFRSATEKERLRAREQLRWVASWANAVSKFVNLPRAALPDFSSEISPYDDVDDNAIDELAMELRSTWELTAGPITNAAWLAENQGAVVIRHSCESNKLDAYSSWVPAIGRPLIVLTSEKGSACRSRFNLAHELAHIVLHRRIDPATLAEEGVLARVEGQANRFAGAFLVPATALRREVVVADLDCFVRLKRKWKVSISSLLVRATQLSLLTKRQQSSLWKQLSGRGWKLKEPLDDELPIEEPRLVAIINEKMKQLDDSIVSDVLDNVSLYGADLALALGVDPGTLPEGRSAENEISEPSISVLPFRESIAE